MVIPRGVRFAINLAPGTTVARGHICEIWGAKWELPELGPLGGHGLANARDFLFPVAAIDEDLHVPYEIVVKNNGKLVKIEQDHSPFDVVAWHGNCVPYKVSQILFLRSQVEGGYYSHIIECETCANVPRLYSTT